MCVSTLRSEIDPLNVFFVLFFLVAVVTFRGSDGIEASSVAIQGCSTFTVYGKAWWFLLQAVAGPE
jgi:hypothetical protein